MCRSLTYGSNILLIASPWIKGALPTYAASCVQDTHVSIFNLLGAQNQMSALIAKTWFRMSWIYDVGVLNINSLVRVKVCA